MMRKLNGRIAFAAILSIFGTAFASECYGQWGSYGSSGGSSGVSYGSYGSYGGSSGVRTGYFRTPVRTYLRYVANRIRGTRYHYGSYGSSGYVRSYGSSGGSSGYRKVYYRSGGSSGSTVYYYRGSGSSGGSSGYMVPRVMPQTVPQVQPPKPETTEGTNASVLRNGYLTVSVPTATKIYVNDKLTKTPGTYRRFKTPAINDGESLTYEVKAVYEQNGKELVQTKVVDLTSGSSKHLDFEFETSPPPVTVLSLNVPEDAQVTLAGNRTKATGNLRMFTTTSLPEGQAWQDYKIVVTSQVDGKKVVRSKSIDLKAGETVDLTFDFGNSVNRLASR